MARRRTPMLWRQPIRRWQRQQRFISRMRHRRLGPIWEHRRLVHPDTLRRRMAHTRHRRASQATILPRPITTRRRHTQRRRLQVTMHRRQEWRRRAHPRRGLDIRCVVEAEQYVQWPLSSLGSF